MIKTQEVANALYGVWRFMKFDHRAIDYFENSVSAFWKSFLAALFLAPFQVIEQIVEYNRLETPPGAIAYSMIESLQYIVLWLAFPYAALWIADQLDRYPNYFRYITAYNWFQIPIGLASFTIIMLANMGLVSDVSTSYMLTLIVILFILYAAFIAFSGLDIGPWVAFAIVAIDIFVSVLIVGLSSAT